MRKMVALGAVAVGAVALWWRKNPSACPYSQRFWVEAPHPLITRARLREILEPQPGERLLEIGPGTGYYTLELAAWVGDQGSIEILDIQQEMLDHTIRAARERGLWNVNPTRGDAQELGWDDDTFDAAILITVLGEIPDQDAALRRFAAEVGNWPQEVEDWGWCARFCYQVIERRGTGGGNFRLMYSRFLDEAGRDEATLAAHAAAQWTSLAEDLLAASEADAPQPELWSRVRGAAAEVLDAEERLWPALARSDDREDQALKRAK